MTRLAAAGRVVAPLAAAGLLALIVASRRDAFADALDSTPAWLLLLAIALQLVTLLARSEAWCLCVQATGSQLGRRTFLHASGIGGLIGIANGPTGIAARLTTLRRSAPESCPRLAPLITAEAPMALIEMTLAAGASFTLLGPLGLPWWAAAGCPATACAAVLALSRLAGPRLSGAWAGLAILRTTAGRKRLTAFVLLAVLAQVARNWLALHAIGVHASPFDAVAILIATVALSQLPIGPSVGAAAVVLILGTHGVALATAAGVLLTATGTAGTLAFGGWALADRRRTHPALPGIAHA